MHKGLLGFSLAAVMGLTPQFSYPTGWPQSKVVTVQFGTPANDQALAVSMGAVAGVSGRIRGGLGGTDAFVRFLNHPDGSTAWEVRFGTSMNDRATAVAVHGQVFDVFVAGTTAGAFGHRANAGGLDAFVRSYSPDGTLVWSRQFGTSGDDLVTAISAGDSGNIVVVGSTTGTLGASSSGGADGFVRSYSKDGALQWTDQFGSSADDSVTAIGTGNPITIAGTTSGTLDGQSSAGGTDAFLGVIAAADGSITWLDQFGTSEDDGASGVSTWTSFGPQSGTLVVHVAGTTSGTFDGQTNAGGTDGFVATFQYLAPTLVSLTEFGTSANDQVTGLAYADAAIFVGGTTDGSFPGQTSKGGEDGWVAQVNPSTHRIVWLRQFGTAADDSVTGVSSLISFQADLMATWADVAGGTAGVFHRKQAAGGADAFWSFQHVSDASYVQSILTGALVDAQTYAGDHGGGFVGFDFIQGLTIDQSTLWNQATTDPYPVPFGITIGEASDPTIRLISMTQGRVYYCVQQISGVVTYGHSTTFDPTTCTGGW